MTRVNAAAAAASAASLLLLAAGTGANAAGSYFGPAVPFTANIGINTHFLQPLPGELEMIAGGGFKWIRTDVDWNTVEPTPGVYNFTELDPFVAALAANDLGFHAILSCCNAAYDGGGAIVSDAGRAAYGRFAAAYAKRYTGKLRQMIELINEPNFGVYEHNGSAYAQLAVAAGTAVHAAAPDAIMVGPAAANMDLPFLLDVFEGRALDQLDAITVHPYRSDSPETFEQDYATLQALAREYAPLTKREVPTLSGEWGYGQDRLGPITTQNVTQAKLLVRQFLTTIPLTQGPSILYEWRDNAQEKMGVVDITYHAGRSPPFDAKPAYQAIQALSSVLAGFTYVDRVHAYQSGYTTSDDHVLLFANDAGDTQIAAWTSASFPHVIRIPGGRGCWSVTDFMGTTMPQVCEDPRGIHVNVTDGPLYLLQKANA